MVGGLQGEEWKFIQKYLKKNIQKCRSQISGNFRRNSRALCKMAAKFSQQKADFAAVQNLPSAWSDLLVMAVSPSFQL